MSWRKSTTRVAIIDDDPDFLAMLRDVLGAAGYEVLTHSSAATAFNLIRSQRPDLAILDLRVDDPEGGWTILDVMRLDPETAHIPAIMCSADHRLLQSEDKLREEGCCLLLKPFDIADLLRIMREALAPGSHACSEKYPPLMRQKSPDRA